MKKILWSLSISLLVASCATAPPKYGSGDLARATTAADKLALYQSLEREIATDRGNAEAYRRLQNEVGLALGRDEAERIRSLLDEARLDSGYAPISVIDGALETAAEIREWNPEEYQGVLAQLNEERAGSLAELQRLTDRADTLTLDTQRVERVQNLGLISELYGNNAQAEMAYNVAYENLHSLLSENGKENLRRGNYPGALADLRELKRLDPAYPGVDSMIAEARTGMESGNFRQQIIDADFTGAWATFTQLRKRQMPPEEFAEYIGPARNLAEYYAGRANTNVRMKAYRDAYEDINREREIRRWIGEPSQLPRETLERFTDAMFDLSDASHAEERYGLEYGYLVLVEEFSPTYATLDARLRESMEVIYRNAIRGVGAISIKSADPNDQQVAAQISAGVHQYLMRNIPDDVEIFERGMLDEIKRERLIDDSAGGNSEAYAGLESADYLIQGELLEADIITEVKPIRSLKRVVTGQKEVRNPAFDDWIREKGSRKADHPDAPPKTIMQDETENIEMVVEHHRKYGEVGVSYWVTDAISSKHLHSNSVTRRFDQSDESREGIQIGSFVQEAKLAQLPSDIEIYNILVSDVVETMAEDLVGFLANPEGDYFAQCEELAEEEEYMEAAEYCANAAVLKRRKELDSEAVVGKLKAVALDSGMRAD